MTEWDKYENSICQDMKTEQVIVLALCSMHSQGFVVYPWGQKKTRDQTGHMPSLIESLPVAQVFF